MIVRLLKVVVLVELVIAANAFELTLSAVTLYQVYPFEPLNPVDVVPRRVTFDVPASKVVFVVAQSPCVKKSTMSTVDPLSFKDFTEVAELIRITRTVRL